jgi:hypothetical protein
LPIACEQRYGRERVVLREPFSNAATARTLNDGRVDAERP